MSLEIYPKSFLLRISLCVSGGAKEERSRTWGAPASHTEHLQGSLSTEASCSSKPTLRQGSKSPSESRFVLVRIRIDEQRAEESPVGVDVLT